MDSSVEDLSIRLRILFKKDVIELNVPCSAKLGDVKQLLEERTSIPSALQKIVVRGKNLDAEMDNQSLSDLKLSSSSKLLLTGTTITSLMSSASSRSSLSPQPAVSSHREVQTTSLEEQKEEQSKKFQKALSRGVPEGATDQGDSAKQIPLPSSLSISNLYSKSGVPVRITFKRADREVWISTSASTSRLPYHTIQRVSVEKIFGNEGYSIVGLHLGKSDRSTHYLVFVPSQYTRAIRDELSFW